MAILWSQYATNDELSLYLVRDDGKAKPLVGLSGAHITLSLRLKTVTSAFTPCTGTATIADAQGGHITYLFNQADVAVPGTYDLVVGLNFSGSTYADWSTFPTDFLIEPST
jgi:hypothetical protein